jgi:hypothetical protein
MQRTFCGRSNIIDSEEEMKVILTGGGAAYGIK